MIYIKTYLYASHELEFVIANLKECYDYIDKMIVCEYDVHHTGVKREYKFLNLKDSIPKHLRDKLDYHACSVYDHTARAYDDENAIHRINEPVMRSWFTKLYEFSDDDIIISVDADEIIDRRKLPYIIEQVKYNNIIRLKMRQFFYKKNYLWKNKDFISAIACKYGSIHPKYMSNWRDCGKVTEEYVGCHFSWCMDIESMIKKLHCYSHPRYRFCANKQLLEDAIKNKNYPFDPNIKFEIEEINKNSEILPLSIRMIYSPPMLENVIEK
jgi:hypothetical protein